ncbi:hypothetical protein [Streptacidiphilus rugosus]|uniref:hypothetical protein n=1 Tax=Streptacidiphilus rugosus TaxID=405783 RepID=UPI00068B29A4|nr:hypothetical protein [Streptacidiphilus rugosus]
MPVQWVVALVAVVAVAICAVVTVRSRSGSRRLRERFGAEYETALTAHQGNARRAERALRERERRLDAVPLRAPDAAGAEQVRSRWRGLQRQFVDAPAAVLGCAVEALEELLDDMGLPADREDRQAVLRFRGEEVLRRYQQAHGVAARADGGTASTEELREGFLSARSVCELLLTAEDLPRVERTDRAERDDESRLTSGRAR